MVIALRAHILQALRLLAGQGAQRARNLDVDGVINRGNRLAHLVQQAIVRGLDRSDDAELGGAGLSGLLRRLHQFRNVQAHGTHRGLKKAGLGAEVAIFWAAAGLNGDNAFHRYVRATPLQAGLVGNIGNFLQLGIRNLQYLQQLFLVEAFALL